MLPQAAATGIVTDTHIISSEFLDRDVIVDCYYAQGIAMAGEFSLLLINDGQDLRTMKFESILNAPDISEVISPIFCVGIHCAKDRKNEYGTAKIVDYKGRGAKAFLYTKFVMEELLPFIRSNYHIFSFRDKSFAGFSLGGLCAIDIVWNHPGEFLYAGVFSGSLWWRDKDQDDDDFDEDENRIIQKQIRTGKFAPWLKFFFEVGTFDETADRNNNGVIDSIDDTLSVINELALKGYDLSRDVKYLELEDGKHDVPTWARAWPVFLRWAFAKPGIGDR